LDAAERLARQDAEAHRDEAGELRADDDDVRVHARHSNRGARLRRRRVRPGTARRPLEVDEPADLRERLALLLERDHVTRDPDADASAVAVQVQRDPALREELPDVTILIVPVALRATPAVARDELQRPRPAHRVLVRLPDLPRRLGDAVR